MRILIVDDEDLLRDVLVAALQIKGIEADEARNGTEALNRVRGGATYDVLVVDLAMPGVDGPTFVQTIRAEGARVPIVFIGGQQRLSPYECAQLGVGPILMKPFTIEQLMTAIQLAAQRA